MLKPVRALFATVLLTLSAASTAAPASPVGKVAATPAANAPGPDQVRGRQILKEMIETDTTSAHGNVTALSEKLAQRFLVGGFAPADVMVLGDNPKKRNLAVRMHGRGERAPILLFAHLDVVEAKREDWHYDPFKLTEDSGYFYGRGTIDIKGAGAALVETLLRLHDEHFVPRGDYTLALTAGEEDGDDNGIQWLQAHRWDLLKAAYGLNQDDNGPATRDGKPFLLSIETGRRCT